MKLPEAAGRSRLLLATAAAFFAGFVLAAVCNIRFQGFPGFIPADVQDSRTSSVAPAATSRALWLNMTDEELLRRASTLPKIAVAPPELRRVPKVAFLFLVRGPIPLLQLWEMFFSGVHRSLYSIYIHQDPDYAGASPPASSVFHGRMIPSQKAEWGHFTLLAAARRLLANALLDDAANDRFVLLSESCIPLYPFPDVYAYLTNSTTSFVAVDELPNGYWRKGAQWFAVSRDLAVEAVADVEFYSSFREFCNRNQWCCVDELFMSTVVTHRPWHANANRSVTFVEWPEINKGHPKTFGGDVGEALLRKMRSGAGGCYYNGRKTEMCFLFARKFTAAALPPLLQLAPRVLGFGR